MFFGPEGSGKLALAIAYAQYINCLNKQDNDSCGTCSSCVKFENLAHPDLHFLFPTAKTGKIDKPVSNDFIKEWRELLKERSGYITLTDWYEKIGIERKQAIINARDCNNLIHTLSYKNYEADYKVMIIWMVEKLFHSAAPKILKILEEPPDKTLFLLVAEDTEPILPTILSRTQIIKVPPIDTESLLEHFTGNGASAQKVNDAIRIHPGNLIEVSNLINRPEDEDEDFELFRQWMRLCFKGNMAEIIEFVSGLVKNTREYQKGILIYSLRMVREAYLINRDSGDLTRMNKKENDFAGNFNPYINSRNIELISNELNTSIYHIERNVNSNLLFLDISLKLVKYLKM